MVSFGEIAKIKKAGNLNEGCSCVTTTVQEQSREISTTIKWMSCHLTAYFYKHIMFSWVQK